MEKGEKNGEIKGGSCPGTHLRRQPPARTPAPAAQAERRPHGTTLPRSHRGGREQEV